VRVAVAGGKAFSFTYQDTLDSLEAGGAEIVRFDPLNSTTLPDGIDGLIIGGGFPEVHAEQLSANERLLTEIRHAIDRGVVTLPECGGLLLLARDLDGQPMAGVLPASAAMTDRLTLGYRTATTRVRCPVGPESTILRGHEFHYSVLDAPGTAITMQSRWGDG